MYTLVLLHSFRDNLNISVNHFQIFGWKMRKREISHAYAEIDATFKEVRKFWTFNSGGKEHMIESLTLTFKLPWKPCRETGVYAPVRRRYDLSNIYIYILTELINF